MSKGVQIAIAAASVFAALFWIVSSNEGTFVYFPTVRELHLTLETEPQSADRRDLRVKGFVLEGSIRKDLPNGQVWFEVRDEAEHEKAPSIPKSEVLSVVYAGIDLPDLFRDGAEVVVEGGFEGEQFVARRVMAKCPSKYENAPGAPGGERVAAADR
jgi:cytochrome c-type biogenesis protein CcmE